MAGLKTTVYLDAEVLTATKAVALATHRSDSAVIEDALREYLQRGHGEAVRGELNALLTRVASRSELDDESAMALAIDEIHASRHSRRSITK